MSARSKSKVENWDAFWKYLGFAKVNALARGGRRAEHHFHLSFKAPYRFPTSIKHPCDLPFDPSPHNGLRLSPTPRCAHFSTPASSTQLTRHEQTLTFQVHISISVFHIHVLVCLSVRPIYTCPLLMLFVGEAQLYLPYTTAAGQDVVLEAAKLNGSQRRTWFIGDSGIDGASAFWSMVKLINHSRYYACTLPH